MADSSAAELFPWFDFNGKGLFSKAFKPVFNLEQLGSPNTSCKLGTCRHQWELVICIDVFLNQSLNLRMLILLVKIQWQPQQWLLDRNYLFRSQDLMQLIIFLHVFPNLS